MISQWFNKKFNLAHDKTKEVKFDDFFQRTLFFLKTCGSEPYLVNFHRATWKTVIIKIFYIVGLIHLDVLGLGECVIFKMFITDPDKFLIATTMAPCILFIVGLTYKEYVLYADRDTIYDVFDQLRTIFPDTIEKQMEYRTHEYCNIIQKVELVFIGCCNGFTTVFSFMPIYNGLCQLFLVEDGEWERVVPYTVWYPFDITQPLSRYIFLYITQLHAAYIAGVLFLGADLMMCAAISQNCMHLNYISRTILNYKPKGEPKDIVFLGNIAKYHGKILE